MLTKIFTIFVNTFFIFGRSGKDVQRLRLGEIGHGVNGYEIGRDVYANLKMQKSASKKMQENSGEEMYEIRYYYSVFGV